MRSLAKKFNGARSTMGLAVRSDHGLKSFSPVPKQLLTTANKENRVLRGQLLLTWLKHNPSTVKVFSDKKNFTVDGLTEELHGAIDRRNDRWIAKDKFSGHRCDEERAPGEPDGPQRRKEDAHPFLLCWPQGGHRRVLGRHGAQGQALDQDELLQHILRVPTGWSSISHFQEDPEVAGCQIELLAKGLLAALLPSLLPFILCRVGDVEGQGLQKASLKFGRPEGQHHGGVGQVVRGLPQAVLPGLLAPP